jgi:GR25 family glycosyltransferase involved in LPS biosynthesis
MDSRPDRMKNFHNEFTKSDLHLPYKRISAINGKKYVLENNAENRPYYDPDKDPANHPQYIEGEMPPHLKPFMTSEIYKELSSPKYSFNLSYGAVGCYLSHLSIYNDVIEKDLCPVNTYIMVFEDDVKIPHNLKEMIDRRIGLFPDDADIMLIDFYTHKRKKCKNNFYKVSSSYLLSCYLINIRGMQKCLRQLLPMKQQIDIEMGNRTKPTFPNTADPFLQPLNIYTIDSFPYVVQNVGLFDSNIQTQSFSKFVTFGKTESELRRSFLRWV